MLDLSPNLFARNSLLYIASTIGKAIVIDKAIQIKSRPRMERDKVNIDMMENLQNRIW